MTTYTLFIDETELTSARAIVGPTGNDGSLTSVNGDTGPAVVLDAADVGARSSVWVPDWTDITGKPATFTPSSHVHVIADTTGLQATLDAKAALASPALTGTPTSPTATNGTNTTQIATTAFVQAAVSSSSLPSFTANQYKVLAVNAGATDKEWVSTGWKQIATSSLSGATGVTFSSIPQIYTDLLVTFENMSTVGTPDLNLSMSYDGVTWLANALIISTLVAAGSYSFDLEVHAYTRIHGLLFHCIRTMTPFITPTGTSAGEWRLSAAGVNHLRLTLSSSTFDAGTATLWGR